MFSLEVSLPKGDCLGSTKGESAGTFMEAEFLSAGFYTLGCLLLLLVIHVLLVLSINGI